jgi:hypothetical protein
MQQQQQQQDGNWQQQRDACQSPPSVSTHHTATGSGLYVQPTGRMATGCSEPDLLIVDPFGPAWSPQLPANHKKLALQASPAGYGHYQRWLLAAAMLMLVLAAILVSIGLTGGYGSKNAQTTWQVPLCGATAAGQPPCPFPVGSPASQANADGAPAASPVAAAALADAVSIALAVAEAATPPSVRSNQASAASGP